MVNVWDGITIDTALLAGYGYNDPVTVDGTAYPRYLAYVVAGYTDIAAYRAAAAVSASANARNYVLNAQFRVQQRGAGPWTTAASYTADRWFIWLSAGCTCSATLVAAADADRTAIGDQSVTHYWQGVVVGGSAYNDFCGVSTNLENVRRLAGKVVTVSFTARATSGTPKLAFSLGQSFGSGGSALVQLAPVAVTLSTTWARYSSTFTLPSLTGKTVGSGNDHKLILDFLMSGGAGWASWGVTPQSYTLQLVNVMLEEAAVLNPFSAVSDATDLAACKRHYQIVAAKLTTYVSASQAYGYTVMHPIEMRVAPTAALSGQAYTNAATMTAASLTASSAYYAATSSAGGATMFSGTVALSADL
jgi:hypothetical protein